MASIQVLRKNCIGDRSDRIGTPLAQEFIYPYNDGFVVRRVRRRLVDIDDDVVCFVTDGDQMIGRGKPRTSAGLGGRERIDHGITFVIVATSMIRGAR